MRAGLESGKVGERNMWSLVESVEVLDTNLSFLRSKSRLWNPKYENGRSRDENNGAGAHVLWVVMVGFT